MSDRLKQIWDGFSSETTRNLTGSGIDNINVPNRREWRTEDEKFLPQDFEAPAERAFAALQYKMSEAVYRHGKKQGKKSSRKQDRQNPGAPAMRSAYGLGEAHTSTMKDDDPRRALLASLRETDFRVLRREINYSAQGAHETEKMLKNKPKKKRFGLF